MIDLYTAGTPNGRKASVMLEELGLPYTLHALDLKKDDQKKPSTSPRTPTGASPPSSTTTAPRAPVTVFESGAILIYLPRRRASCSPPPARPATRPSSG